jgi:hypothetical protein
MTNIDELFKGANGATKRKYENPREADPTQAYKSVKLSSNSDVKQNATVADEAEGDDDNDDDEAGPSLPPDFEEDGPGDDDEGHFFGGGLDEDTKDAMDYLDAQDGEEAIQDEKYDAVWLRKLCLNFEKRVNKNSTLRAKHEDDPTKFMESEGDLDESVKSLSILSEHVELYADFAKNTAAAKLVELLAHENTDIAIAAIEMISELTDEDVSRPPNIKLLSLRRERLRRRIRRLPLAERHRESSLAACEHGHDWRRGHTTQMAAGTDTKAGETHYPEQAVRLRNSFHFDTVFTSEPSPYSSSQWRRDLPYKPRPIPKRRPGEGQ